MGTNRSAKGILVTYHSSPVTFKDLAGGDNDLAGADFDEVFVQVITALDAQAVRRSERARQIENGVERFTVMAARGGFDQRFTVRIDDADPVTTRFAAPAQS